MQLTKLLEQGRLLRLQSHSAAMGCFEQCMQQAESNSDHRLLVSALTELALELTETGQLEALHRAKNLLLRAEALITGCKGYEIESAYLLYCRGILHLQWCNFVDSLVHLRAAYRAYGNEAQGLSLADDGLGRYYNALGDFQASLFHFERSLSRRKHFDQDHLKGLSYSNLGKVNLQMNLHELAEQYFQQSLEIALKWEDRYLRISSLQGLGQVAIARQQWNIASDLLGKALEISGDPLDIAAIACLHLDQIETLLGMGRFAEAQNRVETEAVPRFERLNNHLGLASAKRLLGRILSTQLEKTVEQPTEEQIEVVEDCFLEASILFEQQGIPQEYAKTLYDMACLYRNCSTLDHRYQYQGKAVRSLELALGVLERVNYGATSLVFQIEVLLNQVDQTAWLNRAVTRLRGRKLVTEARAIGGQKEEVTLLFADLCDYNSILENKEPDTVMQLINTYLRYMSEILQRHQGILCHYSGNGMMAIFRTQKPAPKAPNPDTISPNTPAKEEQVDSTSEISESGSDYIDPSTIGSNNNRTLSNNQSNLQSTLRALLSAQEMLTSVQAFNDDLAHRGITPQQIRIGIDTGTAIIGNVGTYAKVDFTAIGSIVNLTSRLCNVAKPGQIRLGKTAYEILRKILPYRAIVVTELIEQFQGKGEVPTYIVDEFSYYYQTNNKPAWLSQAKYPAVIKLKLPLVAEMEETCISPVIIVVGKLGFTASQCDAVICAVSGIYKKSLLHAPRQEELFMLCLPEETKLEMLISLEAVDETELKNMKIAFEDAANVASNGFLTKVSEHYIENTANSLSIRIVQYY